MSRVYSVSLLLADCPCLVVGGGRVGTRKVADLVPCGARVTVVSPAFSDELLRREDIVRIHRPFEDGDVEGQRLIFAAASDPAVNRRASTLARERGAWVNVVDTPGECDFYVPATVRRGDLTISISTGGASPALARSIRMKLEDVFPERYADYVALQAELRSSILAAVDGEERRKSILHRLADERTWRLFENDGPAAVRALARQLIEDAR